MNQTSLRQLKELWQGRRSEARKMARKLREEHRYEDARVFDKSVYVYGKCIHDLMAAEDKP